MTRGSQVRALAWGAGLAAAGAVIAYVLAGGRWAVAGVAIGAVAGAFAPSVYDVVRAKDARREDLRGAVEKTVPRSWARLLDPRRELVGFVGRDEELASLVAWHEDDEAGRLRLVTGPGGVGKTRLAVELAGRVKKLGWMSERVADGQEAAAIGLLRAVTGSRALLGGATQDEARVLPGRVPGMRPSVKIAEWLRALYPPDPGQVDWIGSVQPDRLAAPGAGERAEHDRVREWAKAQGIEVKDRDRVPAELIVKFEAATAQ